jgi:hypothetical protein
MAVIGVHLGRLAPPRGHSIATSGSNAAEVSGGALNSSRPERRFGHSGREKCDHLDVDRLPLALADHMYTLESRP